MEGIANLCQPSTYTEAESGITHENRICKSSVTDMFNICMYVANKRTQLL